MHGRLCSLRASRQVPPFGGKLAATCEVSRRPNPRLSIRLSNALRPRTARQARLEDSSGRRAGAAPDGLVFPALGQRFGNSFWSPLVSAAPASTLISTGSTAPFSNMSCMRTFPSTSDGAAAAASTSNAAGGAPGGCSVLSNNAIATAGASSVAMATFVADFFVSLRAGTGRLAGARLVARFALGAAAAREVLVMIPRSRLNDLEIYVRSRPRVNAGRSPVRVRKGRCLNPTRSRVGKSSACLDTHPSCSSTRPPSPSRSSKNDMFRDVGELGRWPGATCPEVAPSSYPSHELDTLASGLIAITTIPSC
jgi:hypothetical protein